MALSLTQSATAVAPNITASFYAIGGSTPYMYSVRANGAGGTIDSSTGVYTAPATMSSDPSQASDVIQVRDAAGRTATASILVGNALILLCDILQSQLDLPSDHIYLWDQKIIQPTDSELYVAVSVPICKPFGNNRSYDGSGSGLEEEQTVNMMAQVDLDIISRGPAARDEKEFVLMALMSTYAEQQQEANSFYISRISNNFINLSNVDGAAIPYRYKISFRMQYSVTNKVPVSYYNVFQSPTVATNP